MLTVYEQFDLPDLVYFDFDIGLRVYRSFNFATVRNDVQNKLIWYFDKTNREFNEEIDFRDIYEFILDTTQVKSDDTFSNISGVRNLIFRDIDVLNKSVNVYGSTLFPRYGEDVYVGDNVLRTIKLGHNQFPMLSNVTTRITQEY